MIPPRRPRIADEPFSTFVVLNRNDLPPAERFFLYPVHVSISFLMTKGINSALYLMLLRFLHRDYEDVFRLADSVATDTELNVEGNIIFKAFARVLDDWHPDAHASRLKISLVTIDSGMPQPWNLTIECSRYIAKLDYVSSSCRVSQVEELQLLDSVYVATSKSSPAYIKEIHKEFDMALCYNRQHQLRALTRTAGEEDAGYTGVPCRVPPRTLTSNWPYYQDNTVFGETYLQMKDITSVEGEENAWNFEVGYNSRLLSYEVSFPLNLIIIYSAFILNNLTLYLPISVLISCL